MPSISQYEAITSVVFAGFFNPITLQSAAFQGGPDLSNEDDVIEEEVALGRTTFKTETWDLAATPRRVEVNTYADDFEHLKNVAGYIAEKRPYEPVVAIGINRSVHIGGKDLWESLLEKAAPGAAESPLGGKTLQLRMDLGGEEYQFNSNVVLEMNSKFGTGASYQINNEFRFSSETGGGESLAAALEAAWGAIDEHWDSATIHINDVRSKLQVD